MNIFKAIRSYLFGQTDEEFMAEREATLREVRELLGNDSESEEDTPQTSPDHELDNMMCQYRTGVITKKNLDFGLIDDKYNFESEIAFGLKEGQKVSFVVFKKNGRDIVCNLAAVDNEESWDFQDSNKNKIQTNFVFDKKLVGRVTVRNGRKLTIEPNSVHCDLNKIQSTFIPIVGDWVVLETVVSVDDTIIDLTGELLSIEKIHPLRKKTLNAHVTRWSGVEGALNDNCHFLKDACELGYIPSIGDEVIAEIIESDQERSAWRALAIIPSPCKKLEHITPENTSSYDDLTTNKCGVTVSRDENFSDMNVKQTKQIEIQVKNESNKTFQILYCRFHSRRSNSQLQLISPDMDDKIDLPPNKTLTYVIKCYAKFVGQSRELFVFNFNNFKIGRWIDINVCPSISNTTSRMSVFSQRENRKINYSQKSDVVYQGVKPRRAPSFVPINMGPYFIPERIKNSLLNAMSSERQKDQIEIDLENIIPSLRKPLSFSCYNDYFHNLLYLEETQMTIDIHKYDIDRGHFITNDEYLMLYVENLHERRPSLMIGDRIIVSEPESHNKPKYEGYIHKVSAQYIYLKFHHSFHENYDRREYQIEFQFRRTTLKRCHQAVMLAVQHFNSDFLFPSTYKLKAPQINIESPLKFVNTDLNEIQRKAIVNILDGSARPLPYVIFGPPGTGKTMTVVETILQILHNITDSRILVATPSNSSADLIAHRLLDANVLLPGDLVRLVSYRSFIEATIPERLIPFSTTGDLALEGTRRADQNVKQSSLSTLGRHRITVGTCATLGILYNMGFARGHFSHLVIDEAGQATEPEIMIPITLIDPSSGQIILAGDPMQLGPVVSRIAGRFGLEESFLVRLTRRYPYQRDTQTFPQSDGFDPRLITRLLYNYRSLPEILKLPSDMFYDSQLIPTISAEDSDEAKLIMSIADLLPKSQSNKTPALVFHGVRGYNQREGDSPSWYNAQEATQIFLCIMDFLKRGIKTQDIGIISPYSKQVKVIKTLLMSRELDDMPKIGSVEEFQGQERNIIFVSTVRSENSLIETDIKYKLGFVSNPQRFNVAITRARAINIIVGDPYVLNHDACWRSLLAYCVENNSYVGCDLPTVYDSL